MRAKYPRCVLYYAVMSLTKLSILIPAYNEAKTIAEILKRVIAADTRHFEKEIMVIDNNSTDNTAMLARLVPGVRVLTEKRPGKGRAIVRGLREATGDLVLFQDADLEYDPADIKNLLEVIHSGAADVVYGSRNLSPATRRGALIPRIGVWCITKLINTLYGLRLTDVWTCYKLFPRTAAGAFAAGGFVYISASDLIPEIRKETNTKKSIKIFLVFLVGIFFMYLVKFIHH